MFGKIIRWIQFWFVFLLATLFATTFAGVVWVLMSISVISEAKASDLVHSSGIFWSYFIFIGMKPWWSITVIDREKLLKDQGATVIVSNHQSVADIWSAYFLCTQFRWLSKVEVFKTPLIGKAMKVAGYIPLDRKNRESRANVLELCRNRLQQGTSMFFYPEGTRSKDGNLKTFHMGAFQLATEEKIPLQPIVISDTKSLFIKGGGIPGVARVKLKVLDSIPFDETRTKEELKKNCHEIMTCELKTIESA